jgi:hypothetical protein
MNLHVPGCSILRVNCGNFRAGGQVMKRFTGLRCPDVAKGSADGHSRCSSYMATSGNGAILSASPSGEAIANEKPQQ